MKKEKERDWLITLYESEHTKDLINLKISPKPACIKDFERLACAGENNKEFRQWVKKLIDMEVFVFIGKISRGMRNNVISDGYIIDGPKLVKYEKTVKDHKKYDKYYNKGTVLRAS
jgi:hypothetical protein